VTNAPIPLEGVHRTLGEVLAAAGVQFAEREAYRQGEQSLSFGRWLAAAEGLAAGLADMGVRPGDVVGIMLPSSLDYAICYAAISRLGAIATGINTRLGAAEVRAIVGICTPRIVIADDAAPAGLEHLMVLRRSAIAGLASSGRKVPVAAVQPTDPATIIWTSGTTGTPKGAWFDHHGLAAAVQLAGPLAAAFDRRLVGTPFAHAGYMAKLWEQAAFGITIVISPVPWSAAEMARSIAHDEITVAGGVPTQWSKLLTLPQAGALDTTSLRLCVSATAPASAQLVTAVQQTLRRPLIVRYSMTECPTVTGTNTNDDPAQTSNTVGRPLPGAEVWICDASDTQLPIGVIGRIHVRAPCGMRGYWNAPEATADVMAGNRWIRSGDLGFIDANGCLVIAGRTSEMYIRGGYNVYPQEVERHLSSHPAVSQACVVGIPAPVIGEIGVAVVVPADPLQPPDLDTLRAWCDGAIADYKRPDRLLIVDALPLTPLMKLDRRALYVTLTAQGN